MFHPVEEVAWSNIFSTSKQDIEVSESRELALLFNRRDELGI
jgi:hypothetical protein